ncbi:hypothetical protein [Xanthomarina spongicola]|uniref:Uncharacterized protein n=1 Tax=Xanthomarina spongicola TaxID=570520 RepID=A0A316DNZ8_9FLAO|nr:hypothetical protein [Xanthomarina spongicola]PWK19781.1 hypothetical protein LX78_01131 [Xanthomarina spongicola]
MKKFMFLITALVLGGLTVSASNTNKPNQIDNSTTWRGYGNSFIFVENGIEFSVFPDGQFDFYMPSYGPNINVSAPGISISFNSGYDYNPYLQYDEFGAIIQIQHVPIYYDFYGRVTQIGNVNVNYNRYGYVTRVGGLFIHYNRYYRFSHYTGYINSYNRYYVYRPWHTYYRVPAYNHCVVYHTPYRQYYAPVRYAYSKPYTNNYRRTTAVASRRGNTISRQSELATLPSRANNTPRRDVGSEKPRTNNQVATNTVRPRKGSQMNAPRSNSSVTTKPRTRNNTVKPRNGTQVNSPRTNNSVAVKPRTQTRDNTTKPLVKRNVPERKPKAKNNRTYNKSDNNRQIASNTRSKR